MSLYSFHIEQYLSKIQLPAKGSHKGQNGKLLLIGGSELFHAASKWSLDIASKFVDMVIYSSVPGTNELIKEAKQEFWNGIVIPREEIENYLEEADCVLIGPGMTRDTNETAAVTNTLLAKYQDKRWVIDAGALQLVDRSLLNQNCIITPHHKEYEGVFAEQVDAALFESAELAAKKSADVGGATIVLKGERDLVFSTTLFEVIVGGNAGMTKGGTGDVLAGIIAALYTKHDAATAAVVGSYINKKAGEKLAQKVGPFFNASDLVAVVPGVFWEELKEKLNT